MCTHRVTILDVKNNLAKSLAISLAISKPAEGLTQNAYMIHDNQKVRLVRELLKEKGKDLSHVLIFASSIKSVKEIKTTLNKAGMIASEMHSGLDQDQREETIRKNKKKTTSYSSKKIYFKKLLSIKKR